MQPKERLKRAITRQPVDRIPTQVNYTASLGEAMAAHFGVSLEALPERLGNHMIRVDMDYEPRFSPDGKVKFDWWGVGFEVDEEGYFASVNPLGVHKDLDSYPWPDPNQLGLVDKAKATIAMDGGVHFIAPNLGFALFERAWSLRGLEPFMLDMALDPGYAEALLDRITEIQLVLIRRYIAMGVDGGNFGDDYGAQQNMLFSPKMWRSLIKPRLARMFALFKDANLPIMMHSDGQIQPIIPDLIEIGLSALNPVQPEVLDHPWLKDTYGDELAFYGGVSTQTILPNGSPQEVVKSVADCISNLASDGTGLLIAPSHRMMTDIPMENIEALLDAFKVL